MPKLDNPKAEALVKVYVNDPETRFNGTKSYKKLFPHVQENTAGVESSRLLGTPSSKARIYELLEAAGNTDEDLANDIKRLRTAHKVIVTKTGEKIEVPDNSVQADMTKFACKVKWDIGLDQGSAQHYHVHIDQVLSERLANVAEANLSRRSCASINKDTSADTKQMTIDVTPMEST